MTDLLTETAQEAAGVAERAVRAASLPRRLALAAVALLVVAAALFVVMNSRIDWFGLSKKRADAAVVRATGAEQSAALATNTVHIIERYHEKETVVRQQAEESAHAVEQIPSDDLPPGVLGAWRDGLRNVRATATNDPRP